MAENCVKVTVVTGLWKLRDRDKVCCYRKDFEIIFVSVFYTSWWWFRSNAHLQNVLPGSIFRDAIRSMVKSNFCVRSWIHCCAIRFVIVISNILCVLCREGKVVRNGRKTGSSTSTNGRRKSVIGNEQWIRHKTNRICLNLSPSLFAGASYFEKPFFSLAAVASKLQKKQKVRGDHFRKLQKIMIQLEGQYLREHLYLPQAVTPYL